MAFTVVYDACVLYPAPLRDLLIRLASKGLVRARWTDRILDESFRNILSNRPDLLVRVRAASVNPLDYKIRDGVVKVLIPSSFPLVLGTDLAGDVEAIGPGVTRPSSCCRRFSRMTSTTASCVMGLLILTGTIGCRQLAAAARPVEKPTRATLRSISSGATSGADFRDLLDSDAPVLVLLHGFASRPSEWLPVARQIESRGAMLFVFPEGPEPTAALDDRVGGRAWWKLDLSDFVDPTQPGSLPDLSQEAPRGLVDARIQVLSFLDELEQQRGIRSGRVILGGFSQGATVALDVALHDRRQLRGLALLSGTIVNERDWFARLSSRRGLPVFIAHSPEDTVLPYRLAQRLRLALEAEGWLVTWRPFEGGHALPAQVVEGLGAFAQALSAGGAGPRAPAAPVPVASGVGHFSRSGNLPHR